MRWSKEDEYSRDAEAARAIAGDLRAKSQSAVGPADIYPELGLEGRSVAFVDSLLMRGFRLADALPFVDTVLLRIDGEFDECSLVDCLGVDLKQLLELVEMGKVAPVLDIDFPPSRYMRPLYDRRLPYSHRGMYVQMYHRTGFTPPELKGAFGELTRFWQIMVEELRTQGSRESIGMVAPNKLSRMCAHVAATIGAAAAWAFLIEVIDSEHDAYAFSQYIAHCDLSAAPGTPLIWSPQMRILMAKLANMSNKTDMLLEPMQRWFENKPDVRALSGGTTEGSIDPIPSDLMLEMKNEFFFEPPALYKDPVRFAYSLEKSDNVQEHMRILRQFQSDLENGRYRKFVGAVGTDYPALIKEVNRELRSLDRMTSVLRKCMSFGALLGGGSAGAAAGQAIAGGEAAHLFAFCGAAALATLIHEHGESLVSRVLRRKNAVYLLWKDERNS